MLLGSQRLGHLGLGSIRMSSDSLSGVRRIDVGHDMDARRVGAMTIQQPPMGTLLADYLNRLLGDDGESEDVRSFAYRGQSDAGWPLQSSAYRRLSRSAGLEPSNGSEVTEDSLVEYNEDLISSFRNRRFDTADGARLTDLEALSQLQHLGAATALIDFSLNPLVALWFACQDAPHDPIAPATSQQDGAVFRVDITYSLDNDPGRLDDGVEPSLEEILDQRLIFPHDLLAWRPPAVASARERVVAQHSVLLLGRPLMASNPSDSRIRKIPVPCADKKRLRGELAAMGIDAASLFPDLHGFASSNGVEHPMTQVGAKDLLDQGISAYHRGDAAGAHHKLALYIRRHSDDWAARILLANACVDQEMYGEALSVLEAAEQNIKLIPSSQHWMLYANRANTRAAIEDHEGAVGDYTRSFQLVSDDLKDMLHFNRGNSYFALGKFQEALTDFEDCAGYAVAAYNAGNTCIALGRFDLAEAKFTEAQAMPRCPRQTLANLEAVRGVMSLIGTDQCEVEAYPAHPSNARGHLRVVVRCDRPTDGPRVYRIAGNAGNQGNIGWSKIGEWWAVGGQGFSGTAGMTLEVASSIEG